MPDFLSEALTWSENHHILVAVETAYELHMPPSDFLSPGDGVDGEWSGLDKKLVYAYKLMQKEICPMCQNPIWVCRNEDRNIDFSVRVGTCYSKQALDKNEAARSKRTNGKLKDGQYLYTTPIQVNGEPIPHGTRKQYFESLAED